MKKLQYTGLCFFMIGFIIFNFTFFTSRHKLDEGKIKKFITNIEKYNLFIKYYNFSETPYKNNFEFIHSLNLTFSKINEDVIKTYSLSNNDIEKIVDANNKHFQLSSLNILGNDEISKYKISVFSDYGSWMENKKFEDKNYLKSNIAEISQNIVKYQLLRDKGFDKYEKKQLKYDLTRATSEGIVNNNKNLFLILTYVICGVGTILYVITKSLTTTSSAMNNEVMKSKMTNRGCLAFGIAFYFIFFYILLYFYPEYMTNWVLMTDPISEFINGSQASRFFLYGFIYTICIIIMGIRMMIKHRHSNYQILRTISVMFFQLSFAFLIPEFLVSLNMPYFDFKNIWPLDYDFFFDNELETLINNGTIGLFMLVWGIFLAFIGVPIFVFFFGKRWYCSWVCGCGGLAETLGDSYRHLSNKSVIAWKIERWSIHSILIFAIVMTAGVLYTFFTQETQILGINSYDVRSVYGSFIGAGFAGVIGTGFYPIFGNRVWCRFGCPLAAYMGIIQRFKSKFRITTNGGQCISCGNCSTYCEMGIDVRWYAQRGQNIVRSSCVGCGICSSVCPRGVLKLENTKEKRNKETRLVG